MAKFNVKNVQTARTFKPSAIGTATGDVPTMSTYEGGAGYARDEKSELFLLAVSNLVGEDTFYEGKTERDERYRKLIAAVAVADPSWMVNFIHWLRTKANMRSASVVGGLEAAKAMVAASVVVVDEFGVGAARRVVDAGIQRADEPGEALAYWLNHYGKVIPKPIKRGIADAASRLYTQYSLLKYDTAGHDVRFGRVLDLTHPTASSFEQNALFKFALDRMRGHETPGEVTALLDMVRRNAEWRHNANATPLPVDGLLDHEHLRGAGLTWEDVLSLVGSKIDKKDLWEALIPMMGYMATLRNLRNFDEADVSDAVADAVAKRLADPANVKDSKQFPFRFWNAYEATSSLRWASALEKAINLSLANVPVLPGRSLILVDLSGSMYGMKMSAKASIDNATAAKIFGAALALRAEVCDLYGYSDMEIKVDVPKNGSLLRLVQRGYKDQASGTNTWGTVQKTFANHDRIIIVTDEQTYGLPVNTTRVTNYSNTPIYVWNLGGYKPSSLPKASNFYAFGGLSDQAFGMISLLEAGRDAKWPWENDD
jgi:hypothetical protein